MLLRESWKELFLLHLAQWSLPWDLTNLLRKGNEALSYYEEKKDEENEKLPRNQFHHSEYESNTNTDEIQVIRQIFTKVKQLSPDSNEFGCLKAIILFSPRKYIIRN